MTVHAAKGLEFPVVFVIGMEEGVFPHANSIAAGDVEEERRLCYVAITRAENRLMLSRARVRRGFGETRRNAPSRFLSELPADAVHAQGSHRPKRRPQLSWSRGTSSSSFSQPERGHGEDEHRWGGADAESIASVCGCGMPSLARAAFSRSLAEADCPRGRLRGWIPVKSSQICVRIHGLNTPGDLC